MQRWVALGSDRDHDNGLEWHTKGATFTSSVGVYGLAERSCSAAFHDHNTYTTGPGAAWVSSRGSLGRVEGP